MAAITFEFERAVTAPISQVRRDIARVLRDQGFNITGEQTTLIEAQKGSKLGAAIRPSKAPFMVEVRLVPSETGSSVSVAMKDQWLGPFSFGMNGTYRGLFQEAQRGIDGALAALDPAAARDFEPPRFNSKHADNLFDRANTSAGRAVDKTAEKAEDAVAGKRGQTSPKAWKGVRRIRFDSSEGSTVLDPEQTQAHLTVAMLVGSQAGSMPENLAQQVERFAAKVESLLGSNPAELMRVPISDEERPVFEFMHQQTRIREMVPLRTLNICQDCRFEKVTNPDYERLIERTRKLRSMGGALGATVSLSSGSVHPFVLVGKLFQMKKLEPDFVCPRCQGMRSESFIITFCPHCGDRRQEAVLRTCGKCHSDFRAMLQPEQLWQELSEEPEVSAIAGVPHIPPPRPDVAISPASTDGTPALAGGEQA